MANSVDRVRALLEEAAAELVSRREDVLSGTLVWPPGGLDADDCAAFLLAIEQRLAVLDSNGYVTVRDTRFQLLGRSGIGVGVDAGRIAQVRTLAVR